MAPAASGLAERDEEAVVRRVVRAARRNFERTEGFRASPTPPSLPSVALPNQPTIGLALDHTVQIALHWYTLSDRSGYVFFNRSI